MKPFSSVSEKGTSGSPSNGPADERVTTRLLGALKRAKTLNTPSAMGLTDLMRFPTTASRECHHRLRQTEIDMDRLQLRIGELEAKLAESEVLRRIRLRDMCELEDLMRMVALPSLPPRAGREHDLSILMGTSVCEAFYVIDALHKALHATDGAVCEFGVAQGATSRLLAQEIKDTDQKLYLFDSFEGLPEPSEKDKLLHDIFGLGSMAAYAGTMRRPESEVLTKLAEIDFPLDRCVIMKGWADQTLKDPRAPSRVAFAYVDFDLYEPIREVLNYVDAHSGGGAQIVVDDYGFFSEGAQIATDEFIDRANGRWTLKKPLPHAGHFVMLEHEPT